MSDGSADNGGGGGGGGAAGGTPAAAAGGAGGGQAAAYYESFADEAIRTSPSVQRYKTAEELAKGYLALETRFGIDPNRRIDLPADMNDADGMRAVWSKLGLPEKTDGYGLTLGDKASDTDKAMHAEFLEAMHKSGAPTAFVKAAHEWFTGASEKINAAQEQLLTERRTAGEAELKTAFGPAFDARLNEVQTALKQYDPDGKSGLTKENLAQFPGVTQFIVKMLDRMAEPGEAGGRSGEAATGERPMTPSQAKAALHTFSLDQEKQKALHDALHPGHKAVLEERRKLQMAADGVAA